MTEDVIEQVHSTSQEAEPTQQAGNGSESATEQTANDAAQGEQGEQQEGGKDPNAWAIKRIGEVTRQRHEAERKAEAARSEAERYRLLVEQMRGGETPEQVRDTAQEPDIDQLVSQRAAELEQQRAAQERGQNTAKAGEAEFSDWGSAVQNLDALGITNEQVNNLLGMDDAHKIIYSLGKNPEEAARILSLPPLQQGRELERLAAKPVPQAPAKPVSKAPAPVKPIDGGVSAEKDPSKMSAEEWMAWRNKTKQSRF